VGWSSKTTSAHTDLIGITGNPAVEDPTIVLMMRGAQLPAGERLLVFDDISEIVSAQRTQAWAEVARRLAHEIKNPLTPIQLSAERIQHKLQAKLDEANQHILVKSVRTIVDQVEAMKRLVNEFRDFGRLPRAALKPIDLNLLIMEILQLYEADARKRIEGELSPTIPLVLADAEQLRQVIHNLIQNAQDACEAAAEPMVKVATVSNEKRDRVKLIISDNGPGFADKILKMAFEPYITTKEKGTGLGLVIVKKIADEHHARIELGNIRREIVENGLIREKVLGAKVTISLKVAKTNEK
jgi:nitrogen fixation/metabolism regulation signal transduction histidine kinase